MMDKTAISNVKESVATFLGLAWTVLRMVIETREDNGDENMDAMETIKKWLLSLPIVGTRMIRTLPQVSLCFLNLQI